MIVFKKTILKLLFPAIYFLTLNYTDATAQIKIDIKYKQDTAFLNKYHKRVYNSFNQFLREKNLKLCKLKYDTLMAISDLSEELRHKASNMAALANLLHNENKIQQADSVANLAEAMYIELIKKDPNRRRGLVTLNNIRATNYSYIGMYNDALKTHRNNYMLSKEIGDTSLIIPVTINLLNLESKLNNRKEAFELAAELEKTANAYSDKYLLCMVYGSIANLERENDDTTKAMLYYEKGIELSKLHDIDASLMLNNYTNLLPKDKRQKMYLYAFHQASKYNNHFAAALSQGNLANLYKDLGRYDSSLAIYNRIIKIFEAEFQFEKVIETYNNIGRVFELKKDLKKAHHYFNLSLSLCDQYGEGKMKMSNYRHLALNSEKLNDFKLASAYWKRMVFCNDSLNKLDNETEFLRLNTKHKLEQQKSELTAKAKEHSIKLKLKAEEMRQRKNIILYSSITILLILLIFTTLIYRSLQANKKARKTIAEQKEEVEEQKQLVEEKQKEILDSINYAQKIQQAHLPNEKFLAKNLERLNKH